MTNQDAISTLLFTIRGHLSVAVGIYLFQSFRWHVGHTVNCTVNHTVSLEVGENKNPLSKTEYRIADTAYYQPDMERCTRRSFLIVFFLLVYFLFCVTGRICYHCDSRHGDCPEDSVNGTKKTTCAKGNDFCEVVKDGRHVGEPRFIRDCVSECDKEYVNWNKDGEEYCHMCCDEDACNVGRCGAAAFSLARLLAIFSIIITSGMTAFA